MNFIDLLKIVFSFLSSILIVIIVCCLGQTHEFLFDFLLFWFSSKILFSFHRLVPRLSILPAPVQSRTWTARSAQRTRHGQRRQAKVEEDSSRLRLYLQAKLRAQTTQQTDKHTSIDNRRKKGKKIKQKWISDAQNQKTWWTCNTAICCACPRIIRWNIISIMDWHGELDEMRRMKLCL